MLLSPGNRRSINMTGVSIFQYVMRAPAHVCNQSHQILISPSAHVILNGWELHRFLRLTSHRAKYVFTYFNRAGHDWHTDWSVQTAAFYNVWPCALLTYRNIITHAAEPLVFIKPSRMLRYSRCKQVERAKGQMTGLEGRRKMLGTETFRVNVYHFKITLSLKHRVCSSGCHCMFFFFTLTGS